jgi:chorismate synthase
LNSCQGQTSTSTLQLYNPYNFTTFFMRGNSFGKAFNITTFGESHGKAIGVIIDGCPAGLTIDEDFIQSELDRRRPGQSKIVTQRKESDTVQILSGVFEGKSTGTPISMVINNADARSKDYSHIADRFRPSHADFTYHEKYRNRDYRGGGRSSARETAARVAAGAIAKLWLKEKGIEINAYVSQVGALKMNKTYQELDFANTEKTAVRCPDLEVITGCPAGLGEPAFDKLHADLAKAMLSINACKGFEYGSGFDGVAMRGSEHNDIFVKEGDKVETETNYSGGIQGGISNGMDIYFRCAFKPVATIVQAQPSINTAGEDADVVGKGRHDPCVVPRAVPIVEAMAALVVIDHYLRDMTVRV